MKKIDYKKEYKTLYSTKTKPFLVKVPPLKYLMLDGTGDPNSSPVFSQSVEALYGLAYTIKFQIKKTQAIDYVVMPLEGLWWTTKMEDFSTLDKSNWLWTLMILQPEFVTDEIFSTSKETAFKKKGNEFINKIRLETLREGDAAQILHIGPYSAEAENIQKLHKFIADKGFKFDGLVQKHHEIYLNDMRKIAPEKLKTIIRQPFI